MPKIECRNLTVMYQNRRKKEVIKVLDDLSVNFESEKFSLILGPSGCGKTTLLRVIAGLERHVGAVLYNGIDSKVLEVQNKSLSYVSQNYVLYPNMTVFDNIAYPLRTIHTPREEIIQRVTILAETLNISHCLFRRPKDLSGGQKQRVAIARALIKNPQVCLFDEPFSNLDQAMRVEERRFVKKVLSERLCTVIFVTHNIEDAYALADSIYVMKDGKILEQGSPNQIIHSNHPLVKKLLGQFNDDILR